MAADDLAQPLGGDLQSVENNRRETDGLFGKSAEKIFGSMGEFFGRPKSDDGGNSLQRVNMPEQCLDRGRFGGVIDDGRFELSQFSANTRQQFVTLGIKIVEQLLFEFER